MVWEFVFFMLILKIPIVYLCCVVYWAIKAEPLPPAHASVVAPEPRSPWSRPFGRPRRRSPHGGPTRAPLRRARAPIPRSRES